MYIENLQDILLENEVGAKSFHLSKMLRQGFPVPRGFVIKSNAFSDFSNEREFSDNFINELKEALRDIPSDKYMVRSSAIGEDGLDHSFAGQLSSFISGNEVNEISERIFDCWKSYYRENVKTYQERTGKYLDGMGVVVQELIDPDFAGVIFTRNPSDETEMLIEYVQGHGEKLVSGEAIPESFIYSYVTDNNPTEFAFESGIYNAIQLEKYYGFPLDIEWAIKNNNFYIVQARPITTLAQGKTIYWSNTNVNENYPEAMTPLLYSIARDAYYNYFKNLSKLFQIPDSKISSLEPAYANVIGAFGCKMYYNMSSIHEIISASPFSNLLSKSFDNFVGYGDSKKQENKATFQNKWNFIRSVFKFNNRLEKTVRDFEISADVYGKDVDNAISFDALRKCFHGFIEIRMHSWYKASLADFFAMLYHGILGKYCKVFYKEEAEGMHNKLIQSIPGLISSIPIVLIYKIKCALRADIMIYEKFKSLNSIEFLNYLKDIQKDSEVNHLINTYINDWGYRCSGELMLTKVNYCEAPENFIDLLKQYDSLPDSNPEELMAKKFEERNGYISDFKKRIYKKNGILFPISFIQITILNLLIKLAIKGISARERVRLKQALLYFKFKQSILKIGIEFNKRNMLHAAEDIYFLRYQEIVEHLNSSDMLASHINERINCTKEAFTKNKDLIFPDDFSSNMGAYPNIEKLKNQTIDITNYKDGITGLSVCGGYIKGRAKVLSSVMEAGKLEKGDILVTRQTDPGWVVVFPLISGLIVERGGMLSHGAIVSREFGIPAIVGVENATKSIKDNDLIILNADTGVITIVHE